MIGITIGDPAGIGPEVALKAVDAIEHNNILLIGPLSVINKERKSLGIARIPEVVDVKGSMEIPFGKPSKESGEIAHETIIKAIKLLKENKITSLVTAPVSKKAVSMAGYDFIGHTEMLADAFKVQRYAMFFYSKKINIALVTRHIPLSIVSKELSSQRVYDTIKLTYEFLSRYAVVLRTRKRPIIGVLALNPHAGEGGNIGDEEARIILPAIERAKRDGIDVEGPLVPDTAYLSAIRQVRCDFDAFVAMYHDQGLIPLKLLEFERAVNITLGLPFIRTSPSHGTAYDIAGKGIADPRSMEKAIKMAIKLGKF
ncbi:MAG: 4-hydroxythreonine-4-phosphate dehydrogenase PdxA [bacterium]|nr:4-hydroxythreonine-4-phosphate dehydrogenase PdxA [bacterium]